MDSEFFAKVRAVAAESVFLKPKPVLPPLRVGWRLESGTLEVLWPKGSPWVRCRPEGLVSDGLVARMALRPFGECGSPLDPKPPNPFCGGYREGTTRQNQLE
jgi:hypothetical protein